MVDQGSIIKMDFEPHVGHEQAGYRPALVVSNHMFNAKTNTAIVCPITHTDNHFPLHVHLDERTQVDGVILCEQVKSLDITSRGFTVVEAVPDDILQQVLDIVIAQIES